MTSAGSNPHNETNMLQHTSEVVLGQIPFNMVFWCTFSRAMELELSIDSLKNEPADNLLLACIY